MLPLFERLKAWWTAADRNQRVVTLGGLGALLLLLVGTAFFATRPHYAMLYGNLSDSEEGGLVETLKAQGVSYQIGHPGVIEVPAEQVQALRLSLSAAGKAPKGSVHWTANDLTKTGPFTSPEVEAQTLKTILQGEIATTLESMEGVASAQVLITSPKTRVFSDDKEEPTASVTIVEDGRGMLSAANGRTIANLVCGAVDGMKPEDVVVVSNTMGELWNGKNSETSGSKADLDGKVGHDWEARLQSALDVPFGAGNTKVIVRADVDTSKVHTREHDVVPNQKPTNVITEKESMAGGAKTASGFAGSASNTSSQAVAQPPLSPNDKGTYDKTGKQAVYDTSLTDREVEGGSGDLKGLAITVIANSDKISDDSKVKEIVDGVMGGKIQLDAQGQPVKNQPFSTKVTSVPFDKSTAQAAKDAADKQAGQQRMQQIFSILPIGAILMVALLVAKQVGKISRAVLPAPSEPATSLAEEPDALPSPDGTSALPMPVADEDEPLMLEPFKDRVDLPLESLKQMASERPEMVATLIKSMMLGERG